MKRFFEKLRKLLGFGRNPTPDELADPYNDPNVQAMLAQVWATGKPMVGHYDEEGRFITRVIEEEGFTE